MILHSAWVRNKNYSKTIRHNAAAFNAKSSATAAGTAVSELLNSQLCSIRLVSFLAGACILIYFYCLKIELTKNVAWVLIVRGWCRFKNIMLCDSNETFLLTWYDYMTGNFWSDQVSQWFFVMVEIFVQPLVGVCCAWLYFIFKLRLSLMFSRHIFVESADYCAGLAGNFPDASTGCIQQKLFDLLGIMIHCPNQQPDGRSSTQS